MGTLPGEARGCWPKQSRFIDHVELIRRGSVVMGHFDTGPTPPPAEEALGQTQGARVSGPRAPPPMPACLHSYRTFEQLLHVFLQLRRGE